MAPVVFRRVWDSPCTGDLNHVVHVETPRGHLLREVLRCDEFTSRLQQGGPKRPASLMNRGGTSRAWPSRFSHAGRLTKCYSAVKTQSHAALQEKRGQVQSQHPGPRRPEAGALCCGPCPSINFPFPDTRTPDMILLPRGSSATSVRSAERSKDPDTTGDLSTTGLVCPRSSLDSVFPRSRVRAVFARGLRRCASFCDVLPTCSP